MATTSFNPPTLIPTPIATELRICVLSPDHLGDLIEMLRRCSRSSLFHRFHGITDGTAYVRQLVTASDHQSLTAWWGDRCVGLATLAGSADAYELGILVQDRWQRRGVGTELLNRLVALSQARGIEQLVANVLGEDNFVLGALRRIGPIDVTSEWGVYTIHVNLRPTLGGTHIR